MKFFAISDLERLVSQAAGLAKPLDFTSFSISTKIPKNWLIEEEKSFDKSIKKSESVKAFVNRKIVASLIKLLNKKYNALNSDIRLVFDLESLTVNTEFEPIFIFGRYKKLQSEISQSRWPCKKCEGEGCFKCDYKGKNYESIEELIGEVIKDITNAEDYSLHASGREDVDVVNTAGRPFVFEIKNPKVLRFDLKFIQEKINSSGKISVSDLKQVDRETVEVVTESHFEKEYQAEVKTENEFDAAVLSKLISILHGTVIEQRTPTRVAHRRTDMIRKRKIVDIKLLSSNPKERTFSILVLAEAGTYIKELINGDKGRTKPSISELIGACKCTNLKVTKIYDDYLKMIIN